MILEGETVASINSMKLEAENRMLKLRLPQNVIQRFLCDKSVITLSDNTHFGSVPEDILEEIKAYQDEFGNLVYHVVHSHFMGQETYECLAVSPYKDDWHYETPDKDGWTMSHSINITHPENTESGSVKIENKIGVLVRVG